MTELGVLSPEQVPTAHGVDVHPVEEQRFVLVAPPDGPFAPGAPLPRERLAGQRLIVGEPGTGIRRLVDEMRGSGIDLTIAVESAHRETFLPLILKGVGIGVLAEAWRPPASCAGAVVLELDPPASLQLALVSREGRLSPAAEEFLSVALALSPGDRPYL